MEAHPQVAGVQEQGCWVLRNICAGDDAAAPARRQRAAEVGALEAVAAAMRAHPHVAGVQEEGCAALHNICFGDDDRSAGSEAAGGGCDLNITRRQCE